MNMDLHYMTIAADRQDLDQRAVRGWMAAAAGRKHRGHHPIASALRWTDAAAGAALTWVGALVCDSREGLRSSEQQLAAYGVCWVANPAYDVELAQELKFARERRHADVLATPPVQSTMPSATRSGLRVVVGAALIHAGQRLQGAAGIEITSKAA